MQNNIISKLAYRIRYERNKKKLSQKQLAELAGLSVKTVSSVEQANGNSELLTIYKIANALGTDIYMLLKD